MALNKSIIVHLLNKLNYLNEWAQCAVLDLVARFRPPQKDILDYLNLLESRMNHANGAVVFATIKVFLNLTQDYVSLYAKVLSRAQAMDVARRVLLRAQTDENPAEERWNYFRPLLPQA